MHDTRYKTQAKGCRKTRTTHASCIMHHASAVLAALCCLLFLLAADVSLAKSLIVMANKVSDELPLDPAAGVWNRASSIEIPLASQVMAKPRIYESQMKSLKVRALHNTREIAFLVQWDDPTADDSIDVNKFTDAVALEFPASSAAVKPHFSMGDKENSVNIWFWKANWQKVSTPEKIYATVDDFNSGVLAGNPVSKPRPSLVENIIAKGFGSATDREKAENQRVEGMGKYESKRWAVVFKRAIPSQDKQEVSFAEGRVTPVSFAVWDGAEGHRGGRKVISTWYYVGLETEEKKATYIYPVLGFIAALGIEAGIILGIRKRRKA